MLDLQLDTVTNSVNVLIKRCVIGSVLIDANDNLKITFEVDYFKLMPYSFTKIVYDAVQLLRPDDD